MGIRRPLMTSRPWLKLLWLQEYLYLLTDRPILLMARENVPGIDQLAQPELRLAGSRINPRNNGPSRSSY